MASSSEKRWLFPLAGALALLGLIASVYLATLDLRIMLADGGAVDSFCAVSERFDCVAVARSEYSLLFGIPIAVYGIEFFLVGIALLLASRRSQMLRAWQSFLFWMTAASLPVIVALGYISFARIGSLCLVCLVVHGCNLALLATLVAVNRKQLGQLAVTGPREIVAAFRGPGAARIVLAVLVVLGLSQFLWAPRLFSGLHGDTQLWHGLVSSGLTIGRPDAVMQIEEFTDYQCPFCGKANTALMAVVAKHPEEIFLRHRDYPMDMSCNPNIPRPFHRQACAAARMARCTARQGKFWSLDEQLFAHRESLGDDNLMRLAKEQGLRVKELERCLEDPTVMAEIQDDIREGAARGVTGTPTFFVNGEKIVGFRPSDFWEEKLASIRREGKKEP